MSTKLKNEFKERGYFLYQKQEPITGDGTLSDKAKRFIKAQASFGKNVSPLIPRGYLFNYDTMNIQKESTFKKQQQTAQRKKKKKGKFAKKKAPPFKYRRYGKTIRLKKTTSKDQKFVSGTIVAKFKGKSRDEDFTKTETFRRPFGNDWRSKVKEEYENKYAPESAELISLEVQGYVVDLGKRSVNLGDVRMKRCKFIKLNGFSEQKWNTGNNTCVGDYILQRYWMDEKIHHSAFDKDFMKECMPNLFNPNEDERGVSINELKDWCHSVGGIKMMAFTEDDELVDYYPENLSTRSNHTVLMFVIKHGHIYPYEGNPEMETKRKSLLQKYCTNNVKIPKYVLEKIREKTDDNLPYEFIQKEGRDSIQTTCDFIHQKGIDIQRNSMITNKTGIVSFIQEGTKYYIDNGEYEKTSKHYGNDFKGQTPLSITYDIITDMEIPKSNFNKKTMDVLMTPGCKNLSHVGKFTEAITNYYNCDTGIWDNKVKSIDIKRSYTSCLFKPHDEWMLFDYGDKFVKFDIDRHMKGKIPVLGLYIVNTEDCSLFLKSGIYDRMTINYGLEKKIISYNDIKRVMVCRKTLPKDYFNNFEQILKDKKLPDSLNKLITNSVCGFLGKTNKTKKNMYITTEQDEAYSYLLENKDIFGDNLFLYHKECGDEKVVEEYDEELGLTFKKKIVENKQNFWCYGYDDESVLLQNNLPMFIQIVCQQNINLHRAMLDLDIQNILYRKSDCLTFVEKDEKITEELCSNTIGSFRRCDNPIKLYKQNYNDCQFSFPDKEWNVVKDITISDDFNKIIDMIIDGKSCCIQGPPGVGKSFMIEKFQEHFEDKIKVCAFTNVCSHRIGGDTIHSTFRYNQKEDYVSNTILRNLQEDEIKAIIIDEISMLDGKLWNVIRTIKDAVGISIIGLGDNCQLKPIDDFGDYFTHPDIMDLFDFNLVELEWHPKSRHTKEEYDKLMKLRNGDKNAVYDLNPKVFNIKDVDEYPLMNVCYTNDMRKLVNQKVLHSIERTFEKSSGDCKEFLEHLTSKAQEQYVPGTFLATGVKVIAFQTNHDKGIYNGTPYTITNFDDKVIIVENEKGEEIPIDTIIEFLNHFTLGYCMTNHKIQGATLTEEYGIFEYEIASPDWCYVAVSRAKPLSNFKLFLD